MAGVGAGPLSLARASAAQAARVLIETTELAMTDVAFAAGFASVRQFNDSVRAIFAQSPSDLRLRARTGQEGTTVLAVPGARRSYCACPSGAPLRAPTTFSGTCRHRRARGRGNPRRLLPAHAPAASRPGDRRGSCLPRTTSRPAVTLADLRDLGTAITRCRRLLDLDADPQAVGEVLSAEPALAHLLEAAPGRRVPRSVDEVEMAVRAVLGQQVSTQAARTHAGRLAAAYGAPVEDPGGGLSRTFPDAAALAEAISGTGRHLRHR